MNTERNYGIDLLRLVLMYMVCMLHTLGQGGILEASTSGSIDNKVFWLLEILSYCAVDGFVLISGYMANSKPRKYEKLVEMWFQIFFYSFIISLILTIIGINKSWGTLDIIKSALPVIARQYWFFTAYFCLFLATPLLNKFLFSIEEEAAKKFFIISIVLFSIVGVMADPFVTNRGYTTIWILVLYCIGVCAKRIHLFETRKSITLIILWGLCILCTWIVHAWVGNERLTTYTSPTILFSAIIMVILFSRLKLKGTIISKLSPLAFGIYLLQNNAVIWENILKDAFVFVVNNPLPIAVGLAFILALAIFVSGLIVDFLRSILAKVIRIPLISKKIILICDAILGKISTLLK